MILDLVEDPARLNLLPSGETTTNPPLLCLNAPYGWIRMILYTGSFFLILPLHVPAAESVPEGMQSGQLLQAGAPAAGEGTGEQQPHHRTETEGRLRSGRCHRCGECVKDRGREGWGQLSCPDFFTGRLSRVLILPLPHVCILWQFGSCLF